MMKMIFEIFDADGLDNPKESHETVGAVICLEN